MTSENTFENTGINLLEHMRWANAKFLKLLAGVPDSALQMVADNDEWSVARIAQHLVSVSGRLPARIAGTELPGEVDLPVVAADFLKLAEVCFKNDSRLIELAKEADKVSTFELWGETRTIERSLLLAQAVHHAQEHRVQISSLLASKNLKVIDLDALSLWVFKAAGF